MSMVDIGQTVYQPSCKVGRINLPLPVLNHVALLRLVLSCLTTIVDHVSLFFFLTHADRSSSQTEEHLMTTCQSPTKWAPLFLTAFSQTSSPPMAITPTAAKVSAAL